MKGIQFVNLKHDLFISIVKLENDAKDKYFIEAACIYSDDETNLSLKQMAEEKVLKIAEYLNEYSLINS